jgi:hypothetical protein
MDEIAPNHPLGIQCFSHRKTTSIAGVGGITHNLRVGDPACGWEADHVEPCVSVENKENDGRSGQAANTSFNVLSCIGNQRQGAVSVAWLFTQTEGKIFPKISETANIASLLRLRSDI